MVQRIKGILTGGLYSLPSWLFLLIFMLMLSCLPSWFLVKYFQKTNIFKMHSWSKWGKIFRCWLLEDKKKLLFWTILRSNWWRDFISSFKALPTTESDQIWTRSITFLLQHCVVHQEKGGLHLLCQVINCTLFSSWPVYLFLY